MMRFQAFSYLAIAGVVAACLVAMPGCSRKPDKDRVVSLGTAVAVGPLSYTGIESEWRETLESSSGQQIPKNRFLLINVAVVNSDSKERAAPLLQLEDSKGNSYPESTEGDGVPEWLGYLRLLKPGESRSGRLLFDVPQGAYRLRVSSGGEPENEQVAFITIPLQLTTLPNQLTTDVQSNANTTGFGDVGAKQTPAPPAPAGK